MKLKILRHLLTLLSLTAFATSPALADTGPFWLEAKVKASADADVAVAFYLQEADSGAIVYYVPITDVEAVYDGKHWRFRALVTTADLDGLAVDDDVDLCWSARIDARNEASPVALWELKVIDDGTVTKDPGELTNIAGEVLWAISTHVFAL